MVAGVGFDPDLQLRVAICQDDGVAPSTLAHCIGGAIPDGNTTSAWGAVTPEGSSPYPAPVTTSWGSHGSFQLTLEVPAASGQDVDCLAQRCSVYTRSARDADHRWDLRLPITFAAAADTSASQPPTTTRPPSTRTIGSAPASLSAKTVNTSRAA
jgi:hypothetical protein